MSRVAIGSLGLVLIATLIAIVVIGGWRDEGEPLSTPPVGDVGPGVGGARTRPEPPPTAPAEDSFTGGETRVEPPAAPEPPAYETGDAVTALAGRVLTPAGNPAAGVTVRIYRQLEANGLRRAVGREARPAETTGADGTYAFDGLRGGAAYVLRAEHSDFPPQERADVRARAGETVDAPDLELAVGVEIHGRVTDETGSPLRDARVSVVDPLRPAVAGAGDGALAPALEREPVAVVLCDDGGRFRVRALPPAVYELLVTAPRRESLVLPGVDVSRPRDSREVEIRLAAGLAIAGRVVDETGEPIAGAHVSALRAGREVRGTGATTSRSDGRFSVDGLGPGEYRVTVRCPGFGEQHRLRVPAGTETLQFRLKRNPGITGVVRSSDGEPMRAFGILLHPAAESGRTGAPRGEMRTFSAKDGSYTLEDVTPGRYRLRVYADGHAPTWTDPFVVAETWVHGVDVKLERGSRLAGRVLDVDGKPSAGARVRLLDNAWRPMANAALLFGKYAQLGATRTDADGRFAFEDLAPGAYQLEASAAGRMPAYARDVQVAAGGETDAGTLELRLGGSVRGNVLDERGAPAGGARVLLIANDQSATFETTAAADGSFRFANVPPGAYSLTPQAAAGTAAANNPLAALTLTLHAQQPVAVVEGAEAYVVLPMKTTK